MRVLELGSPREFDACISIQYQPTQATRSGQVHSPGPNSISSSERKFARICPAAFGLRKPSARVTFSESVPMQDRSIRRPTQGRDLRQHRVAVGESAGSYKQIRLAVERGEQQLCVTTRCLNSFLDMPLSTGEIAPPAKQV
jgi:hypothetical protein